MTVWTLRPVQFVIWALLRVTILASKLSVSGMFHVESKIWALIAIMHKAVFPMHCMWRECVSFPAHEDTWTVWRAENCPYCQQFYIQSQNRQKKINTEEGKVSWTTEWVLSFLKAVTKEINILSFCVSCCHPPPYFTSCCPDIWALIPHLFQEVFQEGWCQNYD